jgi:hypothetical protein
MNKLVTNNFMCLTYVTCFFTILCIIYHFICISSVKCYLFTHYTIGNKRFAVGNTIYRVYFICREKKVVAYGKHPIYRK